jgi:ribonucleotide reductase beta subunit family protein with ferritin-like domain
MTLDEKIQQYVQKLPHSFQEELLDFVQYLLMKAEQQEKQDWASLSISSAMRDMEDESILYSLSDLKVVFG